MENDKSTFEILRKGDALTKFVLGRFEYSKQNMMARQEQWRSFYDDYRGTRLPNKEPWQSNYIIPCLKESVRTIVPIYMNVLLANGLKSFEIVPGEPEDEIMAPLLKDVITYQLNCVGKGIGGFYSAVEGFMKQFEIYGYSAVKVPWRDVTVNEKIVYSGPDVDVVDIFNFYPDPGALNVWDSWVIVRKPRIYISMLKQLEKSGVYKDISALKNSEIPTEPFDIETFGADIEDKVELLEYHGEVPKSLLEGEADDIADVDPYDDDYVKALIVIANRKVCIRRKVHPYKVSTIFVDASRDKMPNEHFGTGSGEDIQAMARELTNAHNKLFDCVNLIANPMGAMNPAKMAGITSGVILSHPGKMFMTNPNVQNVDDAMKFFNMTAQAGALSPLAAIIQSLDDRIQKVTQAVPVIAAMPNKKGLPETLGATLMMQGNATEPIKHTVKHHLEPWFQRILEVFYKLDLQLFKEESAYRVLGAEKGRRWVEEKKRKVILKEDIAMVGNPDFLPRGVTIFNERQQEIENLIRFLQVAQGAVIPQTDVKGDPLLGPDGQPVMVPAADMGAIIKRIAEKQSFEDVEEIVPSLRVTRERKEAAVRTRAREQQPAGQQQMMGQQMGGQQM